MTLTTFLELIKSPGLGLACLAIGIWWMNRERERSDARNIKDRERADAVMAAERDAFRAERDKRISLLERDIQECKDDRRLLHSAVDTLQDEVRKLLRAIAEK